MVFGGPHTTNGVCILKYVWAGKVLQKRTQQQNLWQKKSGANKARDVFVNRGLRKQGWRIIRIWEHDLVKNPNRCIGRIHKTLKSN